MSDAPASVRETRETLHRTRVVLGALAAGVLVLTSAAAVLARPGSLGNMGVMTHPVSLLGLVSPVLGYRVYHLLLERLPAEAETTARCAGFRRANVVAAATTAGVALLGIAAHAMTAESLPLVGSLSHLLLTGAIWPSEEKLERVLEESAGHEG